MEIGLPVIKFHHRRRMGRQIITDQSGKAAFSQVDLYDQETQPAFPIIKPWFLDWFEASNHPAAG